MRRLVPSLFIAALGVLGASNAYAQGTYHVLEVNAGLSESNYRPSNANLSYGASIGYTLKARDFPIRWYLLANVRGRGSYFSENYRGSIYQVDQTDAEAFVSVRALLPVSKQLRLFVEGGLGGRLYHLSVNRDDGLTDYGEAHLSSLGVLAVGAQLRLSKEFSIGARFEGSRPLETDLPGYDLPFGDQEPARGLASVFLGVHF